METIAYIRNGNYIQACDSHAKLAATEDHLIIWATTDEEVRSIVSEENPHGPDWDHVYIQGGIICLSPHPVYHGSDLNTALAIAKQHGKVRMTNHEAARLSAVAGSIPVGFSYEQYERTIRYVVPVLARQKRKMDIRHADYAARGDIHHFAFMHLYYHCFTEAIDKLLRPYGSIRVLVKAELTKENRYVNLLHIIKAAEQICRTKTWRKIKGYRENMRILLLAEPNITGHDELRDWIRREAKVLRIKPANVKVQKTKRTQKPAKVNS
jgi:hypothetical protein